MQKAITDFSGYPGAELLPVAQTIHNQLVANATVFPGLPTSTADLDALIVTFEQAQAKKSSKATADFLAFELARLNLETALGDNGGYVNIVAKGDATIVSQSGHPSYETTGKTPDYGPPAAPSNVVLRHGVISGSCVARYTPTRGRSVNEAQVCTADPTVEANWKSVGIFNGGKATLIGLDPGTTVWTRFRTVGLRNVMGAWSDPAKIMVV